MTVKISQQRKGFQLLYKKVNFNSLSNLRIMHLLQLPGISQ